MQDSHSCDPGSIPGRCTHFTSPKTHSAGKVGILISGKHPNCLTYFVSQKKCHTPGGTRTHNPWLRRPMPYPLGHGGNIATAQSFQSNSKADFRSRAKNVRSGIRTHAHRSGLRPERSALDRSAILTATGGPPTFLLK